MNIDEYKTLANSSCTWICPICNFPNFETTSLELSGNSLDLSNSFNILSVDNTQTSPISRISSLNNSAANTLNHGNTLKQNKSSKRNKLRGMIINCNGLKSSKHSTEFKALLELHNPDFVLGTESKLHPGVPTYSIFPPTYTVIRKDRNAYGGGVFHAIKSDLACIEEDELNGNTCEILWSSIKMVNCKTLYLLSFYRPPNSSTEILDHLGDSINQVFTKVSNHPNMVIGGDFNLGDIDWSREIPIANNLTTASQHNKFLHLMDDFSLTQHIKAPMRPVSEKTLDLLLSTYPNSISGVYFFWFK